MSRSYKKTPWAGDKNNTFMKKNFNRKLRRQNKNVSPEEEDDITYYPNKSYRKANESWDIKDYGWTKTWEEYWQDCLNHWHNEQNRGYNEPYPNKEQEYKRWKKYYKQK